MDKFFRIIGGRKFLLTIVSMVGASAIDLLIPNGLSTALAAFLGTALTAFCASNWLNSREYHQAEAKKKSGGSAELARIEKAVKNIQKRLDSEPDTAVDYIEKLDNIESALSILMQSQSSVAQATDTTNKLIKAAMQPRG